MKQDKDIRSCFATYLEKVRDIGDVAEWMELTEEGLDTLIRKCADPSFPGIYAETGTKYYDDLSQKMASNPDMQAANEREGFRYSRALKHYRGFLESKYFPHPPLPMEPTERKKKKPRASGQAASGKDPHDTLSEGTKQHVDTERSWRNPRLRQACVAHWGMQCQCCGMDFEQLYGKQLGHEYIEVHHLRPISTHAGKHTVDAARDLAPLCANCHAMIHRGTDGPLSLGQLRKQYQGPTWPIAKRKED